MKQLLADVAAFHEVTETPIADGVRWPAPKRTELRLKLIQEEFDELLFEVANQDMVGVADALADIIYVCAGMALELGIPLAAVWDEVQRSNMAKAVRQPDGSLRCLRRDDGKILKPAGWTPPDIAGALGSPERKTGST